MFKIILLWGTIFQEHTLNLSLTASACVQFCVIWYQEVSVYTDLIWTELFGMPSTTNSQWSIVISNWTDASSYVRSNFHLPYTSPDPDILNLPLNCPCISLHLILHSSIIIASSSPDAFRLILRIWKCSRLDEHIYLLSNNFPLGSLKISPFFLSAFQYISLIIKDVLGGWQACRLLRLP